MRADYSPDGESIAFVCDDGTIRFWRVATSRFVGPPLRQSVSNEVVFSPDGKFIASTVTNKQVSIWDLETRMSTGIVLRHESPVTRIAYTPDGRRILCGTEDGSVYMWSAATGERIGPPILERNSGWERVAFGSHADQFLIRTSRGAELWALDPIDESPILDPVRLVQGVTGRKMNSAGTLEWLDAPTWLEYRQKSE